MKIRTHFLLIALVCLLSQHIYSKKSHHTPQGVNLKNHFGLPSVEDRFGPRTDNYDAYVQANSDTFTPFATIGRRAIEKAVEFEPYPGYEKKLVPHFIKAGEMTNIAPSAKKIVTPEIAPPKAHVGVDIEYPAVVRVPTFYGMKKDWKDVKAYNKQTGQVVSEKVLVESPSLGYEDHVQKIRRHHDQYVDLRNGNRLHNTVEEKTFHGIDSTEKKKRRRRRRFF